MPGKSQLGQKAETLFPFYLSKLVYAPHTKISIMGITVIMADEGTRCRERGEAAACLLPLTVPALKPRTHTYPQP